MMVQERKLKLLKKGPKNQIGGEHTDVDTLMARIVHFMKKK